MGKCSDRDEVNASGGDGGHGVEVYTTARFEDNATGHQLNSSAQFVEGHVIEEDVIDSA